jgi:CHAT domain-containing protein
MLIPPPAAFVLATALAAVPPASIPAQGGRETFALDHMQWRRHEIALQAGQFLKATVHQRGVDVKLRVVAPDGRLLYTDVDVSEGPAAKEPASILATAAGIYGIEVWTPHDVKEVGWYELETDAPRLPDERDRRWLEAEGLMVDGGSVLGGRSASFRRDGPSPGEILDAVAFYSLAAPLWSGLGDACWEAEARTCLGINLYWSGAGAHSFDNLSRALDLWQACPGADYKFAETVLFSGRWFVAQSRLRDAAEAHDLGLRITDHPVLRLQFLVQLSLAYGQLGDTESALRHGEEALPLLRERGYQQGTAVVLTHLANAHYRRGELQQASALAQEALTLRRAFGEKKGLLATLSSLGDIYDALGEPEIALGYLEEAVRNDQDGWIDGAGARSRLAAILARTGHAARARAELDRAVGLARMASLEPAEIRARLQLASLSIDLGDWGDARSHVEVVLAAAERSGDRYLAGQGLELSGRIHLQGGDHAGARAALVESLALRRAIGDQEGEATALHQRARVEIASGDLESARDLLAEARSILARQRGLLATPQLRATWASNVRGIDEAYVGVLMDLHRARPDAGFDARAFEASESASARSLLESLSEPGASAGEPASALATHERSVRERLTSALDRQMRARNAREAAPALDRLEQEVLELSTEHQRAQAAIRAGDQRYGALRATDPMRLEDVQEQLLDANTTLLEFSLGTERGHAWLVGRDRLYAYDLPARARIEAAVAAVRSALARPPVAGGRDRARPSLRDLAALVLPPDRALLRGTRLVVVADGALHHVPFSALPDANGDPLLARFEIASVPSASVAAALRRLQAERAPAPRAIAVVADPVYDVGDERLGRRHAVRVVDTTLAQATRGFDFPDGRLPRLPFTRREALAIAALAPATSTTALDFRANLETALAPDLSSYRFLHFAAHGLLNDTRPELSGLVLSLVDRDGHARPGLLTAPDVSALRLNADLVVLSSCRSAAGREVRGEGLVGLTRAFMYAGAPRVVASLWPVDDLASAELMTAMYRGMLGPAKLTPAAALRSAQRAMLRDRNWKAPYYWAGFQLQGEWR